MKNFIHIIYSNFIKKPTKYDPDLFWPYRLKLFENYTIKSLMGQTNKNFYFLMYLTHYFPGKYYNELERILKESSLKYFILYLKNGNVKGDIFKEIRKTNYVYTTRIDSDDLFHKDAVDEIQQYNFSWRRALVYQYGYCFDCVNRRMRYHYASCPPFSTIMYPSDVFFNKDKTKKVEYLNFPSGHDNILRSMDSLSLSKYKYIVLCHKMNDATYYTEREEAELRTIPEELHEEILKEFNTSKKVYEQRIL